MRAYRLALVWLLRLAALAIVAFATWSFIQAQQAYRAMVETANAVEAAGLYEPPWFHFLPAVAAATLCLALAEILSLLSRQTRT